MRLMCVDHFAVVGRQDEDDDQTADAMHSLLWVHSYTDAVHTLWYNARRHVEPSERARNQQRLTVGMSAASGFCRCLQMEEMQAKACCISSGCRAPPARA